MLARGPRWRRELGGPSGVLDRAAFKEIEFPEDISISKIASHGSKVALALDTDGNMWAWGQKLGYALSERRRYESQETDHRFATNYMEQNSVYKLDWFEKNGSKVLDFNSGDAYTLLKVEDQNGSQHIYGLIHPEHHGQIND